LWSVVITQSIHLSLRRGTATCWAVTCGIGRTSVASVPAGAAGLTVADIG
jgi:hypothetical protein